MKQKLQRNCPNMVLKVKKDEIARKWDGGFLEVVKYPH
jgi:hypothetical protein